MDYMAKLDDVSAYVALSALDEVSFHVALSAWRSRTKIGMFHQCVCHTDATSLTIPGLNIFLFVVAWIMF